MLNSIAEAGIWHRHAATTTWSFDVCLRLGTLFSLAKPKGSRHFGSIALTQLQYSLKSETHKAVAWVSSSDPPLLPLQAGSRSFCHVPGGVGGLCGSPRPRCAERQRGTGESLFGTWFFSFPEKEET